MSSGDYRPAPGTPGSNNPFDTNNALNFPVSPITPAGATPHTGTHHYHHAKAHNTHRHPKINGHHNHKPERETPSHKKQFGAFNPNHKTKEQKIYYAIDHLVDKNIYYKSPNTLHRIRVIMFFILAINWASTIFLAGPLKFLQSFKFYTIWNETFVFLYFFCIVFYHPVQQSHSDLLVNFQHQVITSQTIVVIIYWSILAPTLGLSLNQGTNMIYINCYKHSLPFLFICHEFLVTYGYYKKNGVWICMTTLVVYTLFNLFLGLAFNIIVYPTKFTDPKKPLAYVMLPVMCLIVYGMGMFYRAMKRKVCVKHFEQNHPEVVQEVLNGSESITNGQPENFGSYNNTMGSQNKNPNTYQ